MKLVSTVEGVPAAIGPYSPAVVDRGLVFVSGQMPQQEDGSFFTGDIGAQTTIALDNLRRILEASGSSMETVLQTTVYLTDLTEFAAMNEVYEQKFGYHKPARATVQVAQLVKSVRVEIAAVAAVLE